MRLSSLILLFFAGGLAWPAAAQDGAPGEGADFRLADVQWQCRVLVLFAPSEGAAYQEQLRRFEAAPDSAFAERDLMLLKVPASGARRRRTWGANTEPRALSRAAAGRLRKRFGVPADVFTLVLVGKDGTEKRRDEGPVRSEVIFDEIDAMPMRRREMRKQSGDDR
jgi:hypothetical protein